MTKQDLEAYEARLSWVKALDAATEAAQARIQATLVSHRKAARQETPVVFRPQAQAAPAPSA